MGDGDRLVPVSAIMRFVDRIQREAICLHGFELRQHGAVRTEGYYAPFRPGEPHRMYSVSKSMVALAVGLLEAEGKLRLEDSIAGYFEDLLPSEPEERLLRLTVEQMLRMATCHCATTYIKDVDANWALTFFRKATSHEPGTVFAYDTSSTQVLGVLCERLSGLPLLRFLEERILNPIGATDPKRWLCDPSGAPQGGTGLMMSLRDLGKVAQCVADGGQGLVPAGFLARATAKQIETPLQNGPEERFGYGYQFWRTRNGYAMYGMGGQMAIVAPERGLILCTIADTRLDPYGVQRIHNAFQEELCAATDEPSNDEAEAELRVRLAGLHMQPVENNAQPQVGFQPVYRMCANEMELEEVRFAEGAVTLRWADRAEVVLPYRLGGFWQGSVEDTPCLISGGWCAPDVFCVRCHFIGDSPCGMALLFVRSPDTGAITAQFRGNPDPQTCRFNGFAGGRASGGKA